MPLPQGFLYFKPPVPVAYPTVAMTSDTTPAPYVSSASSSFSATYAAWKAFNKNVSSEPNSWITANTITTGWVKINLGSAITIRKYSITSNYIRLTDEPKNWTFEGSNNDSTWTVLDTQVNQTWSATSTVRDFPINNSTPYLYYRLNITANNGYNYLSIGELVLSTY